MTIENTISFPDGTYILNHKEEPQDENCIEMSFGTVILEEEDLKRRPKIGKLDKRLFRSNVDIHPKKERTTKEITKEMLEAEMARLTEELEGKKEIEPEEINEVDNEADIFKGREDFRIKQEKIKEEEIKELKRVQSEKAALEKEMLKLIKEQGIKEIYNDLPIELQEDSEFIVKSIQISWDKDGILEMMNEKMKDNKRVVLSIIKTHGSELQHASERLRDKPEVVKAAVENDKNAIFYASTRIRNNKMLIQDDDKIKAMVDRIEQETAGEEPTKKKFSLFGRKK